MTPSTTALEEHLTPQVERSRDFFWHRLRWRAVRRYIPIDRPATLVDVGAGAGLLGDYLRAERPATTYRYVEPIESLERALEQRFGPSANARAADRYEGAGIVTLLDVLEHQEDDSAFLRELSVKMEPGALLVVTVPALPALWSSWDESLGHYKRYTRMTLEAATAGLPFRRVEMSYLFPEMVPAAILRRKQRAAARPGSDAANDAAFPDLPPAANKVLYAVGAATQTVRRALPGGTSLLAVLERR
jgi:2-polyprenyl-3-methyl-5-hydroxy-6-metoxy-1,4-benzoquinol methylase